MIVLKLKGGLGNQMFQYASAKVLSAKIDRPVKINLQFYKSRKKGITKRHYCLNIFQTEDMETVVMDDIFLKFQYPVLRTFNHTLRLKEIDWNKLEDYRKFKRIVLDGYFFDLFFLENNKEMLQSIFKFDEALSYDNKSLLDQINSHQSVSIHIRRGDYLTSVNEKIYHVCDKDYYLKSVDYIRNSISSPFFYIFSDDIEWCKKELNLDSIAYKFVDVNADNKDVSEFFLMASCKHNIIANSTYSWWAAYLNKEHHKIVIAPKLWYRDEYENRKALNLIPSDWIMI